MDGDRSPDERLERLETLLGELLERVAQLPPDATGFEHAVAGQLGAESLSALFEAPEDTRTFFERNDFLIQVLLVVAALVAAAAAIVALRRRT